MSKNYNNRNRDSNNTVEEKTEVQDEVKASPPPVEQSTPGVDKMLDIKPAPAQPAVQPQQVTPPPQQAPNRTSPPMSPVLAELVAYGQALSLKTPVEGRWQYGLFELIKGIINTADSEVSERNWNAMLGFFFKSKGGLMTEMHILRPSANWPGSDTEFSLFRRLVWLICETSDPATRRKNTRNMNFNKLTEHMTEQARNRLIGFYS